MKLRTKVIQLTLLLLLPAILTAPAQAKDIICGWPGPGRRETLPVGVASERGLFEKEGLKVRMISFRGTNLMLAALLAGELD